MKIKLGIIFGGKSVEHEISIITASQTINSLNKEKYEIVPIYISKKGKMFTGKKLLELKEYRNLEELLKSCTEIVIANEGNKANLLRVNKRCFSNSIVNTIDVAFPIMHGTNGEDGSIQGFLEIIGIPYVGPNILSSSVGMDKIATRRILKEQNIPSLDYVAFYSLEYLKNENKYIEEIESKLKYPIIVKAGNLGSSVGIRKAKDKDALKEAIEFAIEFSDRIMVEETVVNLKEVNCSVMGDEVEATTSICEEPVGSDEILSYTDKYVGNSKTKGAKGMATLQRKVPAEISEEMRILIQDTAIRTFKILGCSGVARIDFLIDNDTGKVYVNEINTIPGALSYYLWEATNKSFEQEIDELIELAFKKSREKENRIYSYEQNILSLNNGLKGTKK